MRHQKRDREPKIILIAQGLKPDDVLVVNSDTKAEPNEALFLKTLMPTLPNISLRVVLASPTIGSGFSIEQTYFDDVYMLFDRHFNAYRYNANVGTLSPC